MGLFKIEIEKKKQMLWKSDFVIRIECGDGRT